MTRYKKMPILEFHLIPNMNS